MDANRIHCIVNDVYTKRLIIVIIKRAAWILFSMIICLERGNTGRYKSTTLNNENNKLYFYASYMCSFNDIYAYLTCNV